MIKNINIMKAAVLGKFGGQEELVMKDIAVPDIESGDVLIRVEYSGVGEWDIFERQGGYAELLGMEAKFPYILGSEGSGHVVAVGDKVKEFNVGDKVYAVGFLNQKGGFYAEYAAVDSKYVSNIPKGITIQEAAVISGVGLTALRGLEDILELKKGESIIVFGASGGVGHLAVQLAQVMGARVFAVASGEDGVAMVKKLGIDTVINGRKDDISLSAAEFAPEGFDAALLTAGGEAASTAARCVRPGGRIAYPNGIYPEPQVANGIKLIGYNGEPDPDIIARLNNYIRLNNLSVHISKTFLLEDAQNAHLALNSHYLGKLCLQVNP